MTSGPSTARQFLRRNTCIGKIKVAETFRRPQGRRLEARHDARHQGRFLLGPPEGGLMNPGAKVAGIGSLSQLSLLGRAFTLTSASWPAQAASIAAGPPTRGKTPAVMGSRLRGATTGGMCAGLLSPRVSPARNHDSFRYAVSPTLSGHGGRREVRRPRGETGKPHWDHRPGP